MGSNAQEYSNKKDKGNLTSFFLRISRGKFMKDLHVGFCKYSRPVTILNRFRLPETIFLHTVVNQLTLAELKTGYEKSF